MSHMKDGIITTLSGLVLLGILFYLWTDQPVGEPPGTNVARANAQARVKTTVANRRIWLLAERVFKPNSRLTLTLIVPCPQQGPPLERWQFTLPYDHQSSPFLVAAPLVSVIAITATKTSQRTRRYHSWDEFEPAMAEDFLQFTAGAAPANRRGDDR